MEEAGAVYEDTEVVTLPVEAWPRWRALRLAALAQAPEAFGSTLAEWSGPGDTEKRWRSRWVGVPHNLVLVRGGRDVAMVGLSGPSELEPPELLSMWVAPEVRGTGVGDVAVEAVLALAATTYPGQRVGLSVHEHNDRARRLYARHGFVDAGPSSDGPGERRMVHGARGPSADGAAENGEVLTATTRSESPR